MNIEELKAKFVWMQSEDNPLHLVVMRGVPAAGKSFRAKELAGNDGLICSADHYFGLTKEEYVANWCVEKLGAAHKSCQKNVKMGMQRRHPLVIVDNTNTQFRELLPYFDLAIQYDYRFEIAYPSSEWWVNDIAPFLLNKEQNKEQLEKMAHFLCEKNKDSHCVPLEAIKKMLFRFDMPISFNDLANSYATCEDW